MRPISIIFSMVLLSLMCSATITSVSISSPANETYTAELQPVFTFTGISNVSDPISCALVIDGGIVGLNATVVNNTATNITPSSALSEAVHVAYVNCTDLDGSLISAIYEITADNTNPVPVLNIPAPGETVSGDSSASINFSASDNLDSNLTYIIFLNGAENETGWILSGSSAQLTLTGLVHQATYDWTVQLNDSAGNKANATQQQFTFNDNVGPSTAPALAQAGVAESDNDGNIELSWAADANAASYKVYRASSNITDASAASLIAAVSGTSFEDNTTVHGSTYWYAVTSVDSAGNENQSVVDNSFNATANDAVAPNLPAAVTATANTDGSIGLDWDAVVTDIEDNADVFGIRYLVYRSTTGTVNTSLTDDLVSNQTATSYTDTSLVTGNRYYYFVTTADDAANRNGSVAANDSVIAAVCTTEYEYDSWSDCEGGEKERTGTRTCYGGGETETTETEDCSSGSSSGGGSGGPSRKRVKETHMWSMITPGNVEIMRVNNKELGIKTVQIAVRNQQDDVKMTVEKLSGEPASVTHEFQGKANSFYQFDTENLDSGSAKIRFGVEKAWMNANGAAKGSIVMMRYHDGWQELNTEFVEETDTEITYEAETPGFSYFAVVAKEVEEEPATAAPIEETETTQQAPTESEPGQQETQQEMQQQESSQQSNQQAAQKVDKGSYAWLWILVFVGAAGAVAYIFVNKPKHRSKKH